MKRIEACTKNLINAILESEEYRHFTEVRMEAEKDQELHRKINEYRLRVFKTQNPQEEIDSYEEMEHLGREAEEFRKNLLVDEFLKSELRVCRMIQQIAMEVAEAVDLDTVGIAEHLYL